ncbi:MAG: ABC transporter substrate-binding protein [Proteobacteria bacterium]|nr:ABC transporter substrate-binding protein [Pseudomonadota bacterium]
MRLRDIKQLAVAGLAWVVLVFPNATLAQSNQAINVVENLHGILLENMQNSNTRSYQERFTQISPFIEENFDLQLIVKVILSRYWKTFNAEQRSAFIDLFRKLTVATYASRFVDFKNEKFVTNSVEALKKGRLLIKTEIHTEGEDSVSLDYLMHRKDGKWLIISVVANGVNDLSLKRAEYGTIIRDQGYDALIRQIEDKISKYESS